MVAMRDFLELRRSLGFVIVLATKLDPSIRRWIYVHLICKLMESLQDSVDNHFAQHLIHSC